MKTAYLAADFCTLNYVCRNKFKTKAIQSTTGKHFRLQISYDITDFFFSFSHTKQ